jgi:hypothetical protein
MTRLQRLTYAIVYYVNGIHTIAPECEEAQAKKGAANGKQNHPNSSERNSGRGSGVLEGGEENHSGVSGAGATETRVLRKTTSFSVGRDTTARKDGYPVMLINELHSSGKVATEPPRSAPGGVLSPRIYLRGWSRGAGGGSQMTEHGQPLTFTGLSQPPTRPDPITFDELTDWAKLKPILKHGKKCRSKKERGEYLLQIAARWKARTQYSPAQSESIE